MNNYNQLNTNMLHYPFGSLIPGRSFSSSDYRFGFNGHEKDDEVKGSGNHISFNDFGYDPRTGRRWRIDPAFKEYPSISPYAAFANNPLIFTDPNVV